MVVQVVNEMKTGKVSFEFIADSREVGIPVMAELSQSLG